jgi:hypothetical protein
MLRNTLSNESLSIGAVPKPRMVNHERKSFYPRGEIYSTRRDSLDIQSGVYSMILS